MNKELRLELLGNPTDKYVDMFNMEWNIYGNSKIYSVVNVGSDRWAILDFLESEFKDQYILIDPNASFGYIDLGIDNKDTSDIISQALLKKFPGVQLARDTG